MYLLHYLFMLTSEDYSFVYVHNWRVLFVMFTVGE